VQQANPAAPLRLATLLGEYPVTHALKAGEIDSELVTLDFADVKVPNTAFKRTVRKLEFDVSELAIVTYLQAKAYAKPLVLVPAVVLGRFQHPLIIHNAERGALKPEDLKGKRIGVRSWSVTTVTWVRGILWDTYGIAPEDVKWTTFEDGHVAEFVDPPLAERAPAGKDLNTMLLEGEIDAAIVGSLPADPRLKSLIPDPQAAAKAWHERTGGGIQVNHLVAVKTSLSQTRPDAVREIWRMLCASKRAAGLPKPGEIDTLPFGFSALEKHLDIAIETTFRQGLIPERWSAASLFDDTTRSLEWPAD
jgi:4,5-dihydroxyphthalate decarboxylase